MKIVTLSQLRPLGQFHQAEQQQRWLTGLLAGLVITGGFAAIIMYLHKRSFE